MACNQDLNSHVLINHNHHGQSAWPHGRTGRDHGSTVQDAFTSPDALCAAVGAQTRTSRRRLAVRGPRLGSDRRVVCLFCLGPSGRRRPRPEAWLPLLYE